MTPTSHVEWAANLLADVGQLLVQRGLRQDPNEPVLGLSYGYTRDRVMLAHAKVVHEVTTGQPFYTNVPTCLAGPAAVTDLARRTAANHGLHPHLLDPPRTPASADWIRAYEPR